MSTILQTTRSWVTLLTGILLLHGSVSAAEPPAKLRIGTYDSRFVALAFYRSGNVKTIRELQGKLAEELQKAREAKDEKKVKELESQGTALQNLMHQQVFGNLSVPNIMTTINDQLPAIAQKAGVSMIVSKWEIQYNSSGIELIDLTLPLAELFHPDDATRKMIEESLKKNPEPVSVYQLLNPYD
ncbi:hypothetical protein LLG96_06345 [bacterium]|nr:hypothetical protein [bacterium]